MIRTIITATKFGGEAHKTPRTEGKPASTACVITSSVPRRRPLAGTERPIGT